MSDELAKAERAWRWRAEHPRGINLSTGQKVQLRMLLAEFDRRGAELDRIRRVRCLGHVYSGLQPPEQCGDYAGHEGKCQP